MAINKFWYDLQYNLFSIVSINMKLTGYVHMGVVNIYTNFEVIWARFYFRSNLGLLSNL